MKNIHYFQRYSQKENWITNSTLLLFSRFYHLNPQKFEIFINNILLESSSEIEIGLKFSQQIKGLQSIPDGLIKQKDIEILIETKLADNFDVDQLNNHISSFSNSNGIKILLALSTHKPKKEIIKDITSKFKNIKKEKNVKFAYTTYSEIYDTATILLNDSDIEMKSIVEDYYDLCNSEGLIDISQDMMLAVTAGVSLKENFDYNIYYDPITRHHNVPFSYLGLYVNKSIIGVGKVTKIVYCDLIDNELKINNADELNINEIEKNKIKELIIKTDYYDIEFDHKFYLVDKFYETNFIKISFQSLRGKKYFNLNDIPGYKTDLTTKEIAKLLKNKEWQ
ncbi:hypothetical protein BMS3Abin03_00239 [bacterium BMS3Abin03]|nr:hypothetical protein BMS3Abin03_00239 [bacterium BMS3Abin03]